MTQVKLETITEIYNWSKYRAHLTMEYSSPIYSTTPTLDA